MLKEYTNFVEEFWISGERPDEESLQIATLGLTGEVGEVMELMKKRLRDGTWDRENFKKEMGDVIYYWIKMLGFCDLTPEQVMEANMVKLKDRRARGVQRGSGDNRCAELNTIKIKYGLSY